VIVPLFVTVVETPDFISRAERLLGSDERDKLIFDLATNPLAGAIVPGTGGVRKIRWGLPGRGKRGGARVIYYFHDPGVPLFALDIFAKNERADLSQEDRNRLRRATKRLVTTYRGRKP
jgi:hypothetical protein